MDVLSIRDSFKESLESISIFLSEIPDKLEGEEDEQV